MIGFPQELEEALYRNPVVASLYGLQSVDRFLSSSAPIGLVANVSLGELAPLLGVLSAAGKFTFVNMDNSDGLAQDKAAVEYLRKIGCQGILSTRASVIQKANQLDMVTMQKVFVTDRSTLPRSINAIQQSRPHLVQLMPWPVIPYIPKAELAQLSPFIAAGFVSDQDDLVRAVNAGAKAVSTSDTALWSTRRRETPTP
jgi:glycerol uptake operon antiterminator